MDFARIGYRAFGYSWTLTPSFSEKMHHTLLAIVDALHPTPRKPGVKFVQILGGVGKPSVEAHATRLTSRIAQLIRGEAIYLPVSGVLATEAARDILVADEVVRQAIKLFDHVTIALVGIGAIDPSPLLAESGNIFGPQELDLLRQEEAVRDILLRFFDQNGKLAETGLEKRAARLAWPAGHENIPRSWGLYIGAGLTSWLLTISLQTGWPANKLLICLLQHQLQRQVRYRLRQLQYTMIPAR